MTGTMEHIKNSFQFSLAGVPLCALGTGALWWPDQRLLCVSDLHLGKAERLARRGGPVLPPYETRDTLDRLSQDITKTDAATVVCLGDSFDDLASAQSLSDTARMQLTGLQAGRRWIWIQGNHDPGPVELGGAHLQDLKLAPLVFRHIADPVAQGEVSGHYHPKAKLRGTARPAFLVDTARVVLPAYGTYTGGLRCTDAPLVQLMQEPALAILTGSSPLPIPMPRRP
ncbi:ligase-associated DNA damage response endonuclease PdeM [Aliisedimentitalea scapharcae]|uniref:Ligase-associated DNA damage response endonuclease PdeM n=1 Tax=Aliisedimentitalea scapharcae TaxID=1524259 RepID=A0ABZ2XZ60_9RHOB